MSLGVGVGSIDNYIDTSAVALRVVTATAAKTANTAPVLDDIPSFSFYHFAA
jgi:hypothetical protein